MTALDKLLATADEVLALDETATAGPWRTPVGEREWLYEDNAVVNGASLRGVGSDGEFARVLVTANTNFPYRANLEAIASYRTAAPELARALKAVAEALGETDEHYGGSGLPASVVARIRAAIERRLTEGK